MTAPILKWAGGKGKLVPTILALAPSHFGRYHEPFVGGGAVFFSLCRDGRLTTSSLNDLNKDLITMYREIRDEPGLVIDELQRLSEQYLSKPHEKRGELYYKVRASNPVTSAASAAQLIFLNRTCYNGLYRVNRRGEFNVPHGDYANPRILDAAGLLEASKCLGCSELLSGDFGEACHQAKRGDFVYLDPPYQPLTTTSNFTSYTSEDFGPAEQTRLRDEFENLTRRGVAAVLSNSSHPIIVDLYERRGFTVDRVLMARAINSAGDRRAPIPELLISNLRRPEVIQAFSSSPK